MSEALLVQKTNSPKIMASIGAILALGSFSANSFSSSISGASPLVQHVYYEEQTNTPEISSISNKFDRYKEAREVFTVVRDFSEKELLQYNNSLDKLFEPIGVNIFDL